MQLKEIYRPIEKELLEVERVLASSLKNTRYESISEINNYLLDTGSKRLRPALVLLSAKASCQTLSSNHKLINIAAAIELIHTASLVHDDVIDCSSFRHNKSTVNSKWGEDVSIALGDYLFSVAFELVSECGSPDIISCISSATKAMCEGELLQVCERNNLNLSKRRYIVIVKKKTAALFAASCQLGPLFLGSQPHLERALRRYGLNFGIAFQIIDDYLDLVGEEKKMGKSPGQDIKGGEITLPLLNLLESANLSEREEIKASLALKKDGDFLKRIKSSLFNSGAALKTKEAVSSYTALAKKNLEMLTASPYKESLLDMADFIMTKGF